MSDKAHYGDSPVPDTGVGGRRLQPGVAHSRATESLVGSSAEEVCSTATLRWLYALMIRRRDLYIFIPHDGKQCTVANQCEQSIKDCGLNDACHPSHAVQQLHVG